MRILLLSFSPRRLGGCAAALKYAERELAALGAETKIITVNQASGVCLGCYSCKKEGKCISDAVNMLAEEFSSADGFIIASPTHFGLASSTAYSMLTRLIISSKAAIMDKPYFTLATARRAGGFGAMSDIERLLSFAYCISSGGGYPAVLYGSSEVEILRDEEGLFNLRERTRRLYWLSELLLRARAEGYFPPDKGISKKTDIQSIYKAML